jgi:biotin carboxylase
MTAAPTLLILGAGADQLVTYRVARRLGCTIIGVDRRCDAPAAALADRFLPVSVRDPAAIAAGIGEAEVDGVLAGGTDLSLPALQLLGECYATPCRISPTAVLASTNKGFFRQVLEGLPYPRCRFAQSADTAALCRAAARMRSPLIVKPADTCGNRGVEAVAGVAELPAAIERSRAFSYGGEVIVEELVQGVHLGCECFVRDGEPVLVAPSERGHTGPPHFLTTSHLLPARIDAATGAALVELVRAVCAAVDYQSGPLNLDLVLDRQGDIYPIEMGARLGGNGLPDLVRMAYGVDVVEAAVRLALGQPFTLAARRPRVAMSCVLSAERPGVLARVEGLDAVRATPMTERVELFAAPGEPVAAFTTNANKLGILVLVGDSHERVVAAATVARSTLRIQVGEPDGAGMALR